MSEFRKKVYDAIILIPKGRVSTYRDVSEFIGCKSYRAIGTALKKNENLINIPCHRVVCSNGCVGGYVEGQNKKIKLLESEGIKIRKGKIIDFEDIKHKFFK